MANHGVTVAGPTVAEAFNDLYYLERAAQVQVLARSTGGRMRTVSAEVRRHTAEQLRDEFPRVADRHFTALRRMLDNNEPQYRH